MQVFISYKREDEAFARRLNTHIESWGFSPWLDVLQISPGMDWDSAIHGGLRNADIVIGMLTPESLTSDNVLDEWGYALSTGKRLFLLWLRDVSEIDVPPRYIRIQRIDLRTDETGGMALLNSALQSAAKVVPEMVAVGDLPETGLKPPSPEEPPSPVADPAPRILSSQIKTNRERMLEKVYTFWVKGVLDQSLFGAALIELGLEHAPGVVTNPWDTVLQHRQYGDYKLPGGTKAADVFHDMNGELLILGDPGSGKTTTLLELARDLITLAQTDEKQPIPVVFNLSSWADERKPLADWLVDELHLKYQAPRKAAQAWVDQDALLLLLDGLDEVDARYRDACVAAINAYRDEHGFTPIVVCSRIVDYEALSNRLRLNGAIVLQPLNNEQIDRYLDSLGPQMDTVRQAMANDPHIRELAESPLMLSIMTLAYRGITAADLPHLDSIEAQRSHLFETYTRRMFERRVDRHDQYTPDKTIHYLTWLAARMVERKQSVFYIENLQVDWIANEAVRPLYRVVGRTLFGLFAGLVIGILVRIGTSFATGLSISGSTTGQFWRELADSGAFSILGIAGFGGLIFGISGLIAYALDTIPDSFTPLRHYVQRFGRSIRVGLVWGILITLPTFLTSLDYLMTEPVYRGGEQVTRWPALGMSIIAVVALAGGVGALLGGYVGVIASAFNIIQPRRQLLPGISRLVLLTLCVGILSCVAIAVGVWLFNLIILDVPFPSDLPLYLVIVQIPLVLMAVFTALVVRLIPSRWKVAPYVLACINVFILVAWPLLLAPFVVSDGSSLPSFIVYGLAGLVVIGAVGFLVGRIGDRIETAETLRWSWNWRWALVGFAGVLVLALILAVPVLSDISNFASYETDWESVNSDYERIRARLQRRVVSAQTALKQYRSQIGGFDEVIRLIEEIATIDSMGSAQATNLNLAQAYRYIQPDRNVYVGYVAYAGSDAANRRLMLERGLQRFNLPDHTVHTLYDIERQFIVPYEGVIGLWKTIYRVTEERFSPASIQTRSTSTIRLALVLGIAFVLVGGVAGGLRKTETIDIRTRPNEGIRRTAYTVRRVMFTFGLVGLLIGLLIGWLLTTLPDAQDVIAQNFGIAIPVAAMIGLFGGLGLGLVMGGSDAIVKHLVLRIFLWRGDSIPWNYARFLDYAAERVFLRKVGGGSIFVHRLLLEHFASLEESSSS